MRSSVLAAGLVALAPAAWAEGVTINGCTLRIESNDIVCRVTNKTPGTITTMSYALEIVEPGRDQPWALMEDTLHPP